MTLSESDYKLAQEIKCAEFDRLQESNAELVRCLKDVLEAGNRLCAGSPLWNDCQDAISRAEGRR